jgi:hypothetical protein
MREEVVDLPGALELGCNLKEGGEVTPVEGLIEDRSSNY